MRTTILLFATLASVGTSSAFAPGVLPARSAGLRLRMCNPVDEAVAPPPPPPASTQNPLTRTDVPWTERTTTLDRQQRVGGDPLAPKRVSEQAQNFPRPGASGQRLGKVDRETSERDSYEWFKSMEEERSMFGRTMNPLTGNLEVKDDANMRVINPFVDPLFYVALSVGAPFFLLIAGAYGCAVPALSMAFGAECPMY
eukprot:CAMPEP_0174928986 /NCGR_PEP_ID=MMETSP1355-20121228/26967_1 /TAXON_ID=464990 /ORGANISM="Hemiselmis tepida, Strain CCMP443" /LENGTH=197 /DNA_ID=CAMNT_0016175169 /DNA_START=37 /DNA_END=630 /DNA_ORIENTATION=+